MSAPVQSQAPAFDISRLAPVVFVLLWSTGFIGAKLGLPHAEPLTFLLIRMAAVALLLGAIAWIMKAPWPDRRQAVHIAIAGLLVHGAYLGGVFSAIGLGLPAGTVALIVGLQPLLTAVAAGPFLGETVTRRQWAGFALGLVGVLLVVWEKVAFRPGSGAALLLAGIALVGITLGTLYQKRHGAGMDLRSGTAIQYAATAVLFAALAPLTETMAVEWTGRFVFALVWLSLVLSVGAIFLLYWLIRRGAASRVASLFYLTPPTTAVMAWLLFGETLGPAALVGMGIAIAGVALVNRPAKA